MEKRNEKIILMLAPFWTPVIPPHGIACLKSYLTQQGYDVLTVDANIEEMFRVEYENYFQVLRKYIPKSKGGHFYKVGRDLLRNQMMAHIRKTDDLAYLTLVQELVWKNFYVEFTTEQVEELAKLVEQFYLTFASYLADLLEREKPTYFGLSVYRDTFPASVFAFQQVKAYSPKITTIMGGGIFADQLADGSPDWEYFLTETQDYIDKIIVGEGEVLLKMLIQGELPADQRVYTRADLATLSVTSAPTLTMADLNCPDFRDFEIANYLYLPTSTSRSCPFQCKFCSETIQWGKYRKKTASQVVDELIQLSKEYQYQLVCLCDSLLNPNITEIAQEFLQRQESVYWEGCLRVADAVCDFENTHLWRRAGFYKAKLGIESGSQRILDLMDKRIQLAEMKDALYSLAAAGIKTLVFLIVGFPSETEEDFQETLDFIEEMQDYIYEVEVTPYEYYLTGQADSTEENQEQSVLLYESRGAAEMLITQTRVLDLEPRREVTYQRLNRLIGYLDQLAVPNPYTLNDIVKADERWSMLHRNSVPGLREFVKRDQYISENKSVKQISQGQKTLMIDDSDFDF